MKLSKYGFNVALVLLLVPSLVLADSLDPSIEGTTNCFRRLELPSGKQDKSYCSTSTLSYIGAQRSKSAKWGVTFPYGDVMGVAVCADPTGHNTQSYTVVDSEFGAELDALYPVQVANGSAESNQKTCFCKMEVPTGAGWVRGSSYNIASGCASNCASDCAVGVSSDIDFRTAVFPPYSPSSGGSSGISSTVTTQTYVDNALNGKQAKITTTGTNKLMTYGASTGAAPGSRDIVSTLGTSTSATTVPTVGPIVTGINSKQDTVNGIAGRVMAGTGTAGLLDDKLIYTAPLGFTSSLVTAQTVNSIAADAANNELTCAAYATPGDTASECLLWQINTDSATKVKVLEPKEGTGYCYKSPNGTQSLTACTVENKGEWGVVFPDYTVYGIAMCSSHAIPKNGNASIKGYVPNVQYQQFIQDEYDTWVANGRPDSFNGAYCYCKITTPSGSRWVGFHYGTPQLRTCLNGCSLYCGNSLRLNESSESAFINALYRP